MIGAGSTHVARRTGSGAGWWVSLLVVAVVTLAPYRHFAGDDAYISFRFARNLADGHGFAFNPDVPVYGSTAPLWVGLIAAIHRLGPSIEDAAHGLDAVFVVACVLTFWRLTSRFFTSPATRWFAVLLLIVDPWFVRWSLSGMENAMALTFVMGALSSSRERRNSGRVDWLAPLCVGLLSLTRPEGVLLAALLALDVVVFERQRRTADLVLVLAIPFAIVTPWLAYAHAHFGTVVPNTVTAKVSAHHWAAFVGTLKYWASFWLFQAVAVALVLVLWRADAGRWLRSRGALAAWALVLAWGVVLPCFYVAGGAPVSGRYMMLGLPSYLLLGVAALDRLVTAVSGRLRATAVALATLSLAWVLVIQYRYCWYVTKWDKGMDPNMIALATYVAEHSRPGDVVAADQIGVLAYFSDRAVLDVVGLVSPEIIAYAKSGNPDAIWRYVRERRPRFLFLTDDIALATSRGPGYAGLRLIRSAVVQREGAGAVGAPATYYLYETGW